MTLMGASQQYWMVFRDVAIFLSQFKHKHPHITSMAFSNPDFIFRLPNEVKSNIIHSLTEENAANLRLTARVWRDIAGEGLFNTGFGSSQLVIRPYISLRSIADKLIEWPWMGRLVTELEIHLPDKNIEAMTEVATRYVERGNPLASIHRIRELRPERSIEAFNPDLEAIVEIYSKLPRCDTLSLYTERCPWPAREKELCKFREDYIISDYGDGDEAFAHRFQDKEAALAQYLGFIIPLSLIIYDEQSLEHMQVMHSSW